MSDLLNEINKLSSPSFQKSEATLQIGVSSIEEITSMSAFSSNEMSKDAFSSGTHPKGNLRDIFAAEASSRDRSDVGKFLKEIGRSLNEEDTKEHCVRIVGDVCKTT